MSIIKRTFSDLGQSLPLIRFKLSQSPFSENIHSKDYNQILKITPKNRILNDITGQNTDCILMLHY